MPHEHRPRVMAGRAAARAHSPEEQFDAGTVCIFGETHDLRGEWQDETLLVSDDRESLAVRIISPEKINVHVSAELLGPDRHVC